MPWGWPTKTSNDFARATRTSKTCSADKGATLTEMTKIRASGATGLRSMTTTEAGRAYLNRAKLKRRACPGEVSEHLAGLEKAMGKALGRRRPTR